MLVEGSTPDTSADSVVVYTYESLLADPAYDIEGNFSAFSGIAAEDIEIVRFGDANEILTRLVAEQDDPKADVVVGIDNALVHLIEDKAAVLEPYSPANVVDLDQNLVDNLDPDGYLLPYDYGTIALYYQNNIINASTHSILEDLTLEGLLESDLLDMLVVENPKFSSPGLGFLLWTIAVYGDPDAGVDGLLGQDWRDWWRSANDSLTITKSWGEAFDIFFEPSEGKPLMVSYGTSPAYSYCLWGDNTTSAVVSQEDDTQNAWLQIEGVGLVRDAPHKEVGQQFIDWFLGQELQSSIATHQWMYPANTKATVPTCFEESALDPSSINRLNNLISPEVLADHLVGWQDSWEDVLVERSIPSFTTEVVVTGLVLLAVMVFVRRRWY